MVPIGEGWIVLERNGRNALAICPKCSEKVWRHFGSLKRTKSCGCKWKEGIGNATRHHGMTGTQIHHIWLGMKSRCRNVNNPAYPYYGGRGILMCDRWFDSFEAFFEDVGHPTSPKHSIDRIDVNGNYEPGNVRWATDLEQANNRRDNCLITLGDVTKTAAEWSRETGVKASTLTARIREGLSASPEVKHLSARMIEYAGEVKSMKDWSLEKGIPYSTLHFRIESGWAIDRALETPVRKQKNNAK